MTQELLILSDRGSGHRDSSLLLLWGGHGSLVEMQDGVSWGVCPVLVASVPCSSDSCQLCREWELPAIFLTHLSHICLSDEGRHEQGAAARRLPCLLRSMLRLSFLRWLEVCHRSLFRKLFSDFQMSEWCQQQLADLGAGLGEIPGRWVGCPHLRISDPTSGHRPSGPTCSSQPVSLILLQLWGADLSPACPSE